MFRLYLGLVWFDTNQFNDKRYRMQLEKQNEFH